MSRFDSVRNRGGLKKRLQSDGLSCARLSQSLDTHDRPAYPQRIDAPAEGEKFNKGSADHRPRGRSRRARRTAAESIGCSFRSSWSEMGEQRWKINGGRKCYDRLEKGDAILTRRFLIEEPVEDTFGSLTLLSKSLSDLLERDSFFLFLSNLKRIHDRTDKNDENQI